MKYMLDTQGFLPIVVEFTALLLALFLFPVVIGSQPIESFRRKLPSRRLQPPQLTIDLFQLPVKLFARYTPSVDLFGHRIVFWRQAVPSLSGDRDTNALICSRGVRTTSPRYLCPVRGTRAVRIS